MVVVFVYYEHLSGATHDKSFGPALLAFMIWAVYNFLLTWKDGNKWRWITQEHYEVSGGCDFLSVAVMRS
jgi:ABC-type uncharacterized transport system permease subunit